MESSACRDGGSGDQRSSLVFAHQMSDRDGGPRWQPSAGDIKAFTDARIAALKADSSSHPSRKKTGLPLRPRSAIWPRPAPTAWLRAPMSSHHPIRSSVYTGAPKDLVRSQRA